MIVDHEQQRAADPALEAVRNCESALHAYKAALAEYENADATKDDHAPECSVDEASAAWEVAWHRLSNVTPTTIAGAAALASFMAKYAAEEGGADDGEEALTALAASLQRFAATVEQDGSHA
jgi:hypothetical protein